MSEPSPRAAEPQTEQSGSSSTDYEALLRSEGLAPVEPGANSQEVPLDDARNDNIDRSVAGAMTDQVDPAVAAQNADRHELTEKTLQLHNDLNDPMGRQSEVLLRRSGLHPDTAPVPRMTRLLPPYQEQMAAVGRG